MAGRKAFMLYFDYREHLELLTDAERGALLTALFEYAEHGREGELAGAAKMAFSFIRAQLDRDADKYSERCERNRENGAKGGRPPHGDGKPEKPKTSERFSAKPKKPDTEKETDTDTEKETDIKNPLTPLEDRSPALLEAANEWLRYKRERKEDYKPTGLKSLVASIRKHAEQYGDEAVAALIGECMAAGWKGIIWDRLDQRGRDQPGAPPHKTAQLADWENEWAARVKAHRRDAGHD